MTKRVRWPRLEAVGATPLYRPPARSYSWPRGATLACAGLDRPLGHGSRTVWQTLRVDIEPFDIAVVGGGPAGAVAAYAAARRDLRVALIDRLTFPRDKTCGDGIGPGAVNVARQLGLNDIFDGETAIDSILVTGPDGVKLEGSIPKIDGKAMQGYVVPRIDFDERLFKRAIKEGAHDFTGWKFVSSTNPANGFRVVTLQDREHAERTISARLLIGADGAHSVVRKALGAPNMTPKDMGIAIRAYCESNAFQEGGIIGPRLVFEFSRELLPSYGWVFPTGKGLVNVGIGGPLVTFQDKKIKLKDQLNKFTDLMRDRGIDLSELRNERAYHLPHFGGMPPLNYPRGARSGMRHR